MSTSESRTLSKMSVFHRFDCEDNRFCELKSQYNNGDYSERRDKVSAALIAHSNAKIAITAYRNEVGNDLRRLSMASFLLYETLLLLFGYIPHWIGSKSNFDACDDAVKKLATANSDLCETMHKLDMEKHPIRTITARVLNILGSVTPFLMFLLLCVLLAFIFKFLKCAIEGDLGMFVHDEQLFDGGEFFKCHWKREEL